MATMRDKKACKFCGAILPRDAKFCVSCGAILTVTQRFPSSQAQPLTQQRRKTDGLGGIRDRASGRTLDKRHASRFALTSKKLLKGGILFILFLVLIVIVGGALHTPMGGNTSMPAVTSSTHALHAHRIVSVGDSITEGFSDPNNWPYSLKVRLGGDWLVVNQGVGGAKTADMLVSIDKALALNPHFVVIMGGTNDLANGEVPLATTQANIREMCTRVESYGAVPVFCTVPPSSFYLEQRDILNAWIAEYANSKGYDLIDFYTVIDNPSNPGHSNPALVMSDGLHPNAAGYTAMGKAIDLQIFAGGR
jgi:lysophospholipase L1-like esterase